MKHIAFSEALAATWWLAVIVALLLLSLALASAQSFKSPDSRAGQAVLPNKSNVFIAPQQMTGPLRIGPAVVAPSIPVSSIGSAPVWACAEGTAPSLLPGLDSLWCDSVGGFMFSRNAGIPVRMVGTSSGTIEFPISAGPQTFGNTVSPNNYAAGGALVAYRAVNNCHFVYLASQNVSLGSGCTTAPTFNVYDVGWAGGAGTTNNGTAALASNALQARGVATITNETLPIAAGDVYGLALGTASAASSCTTTEFIATAEITCP